MMPKCEKEQQNHYLYNVCNYRKETPTVSLFSASLLFCVVAFDIIVVCFQHDAGSGNSYSLGFSLS